MLAGLGAMASGVLSGAANYFSQRETNRTNVDMANNQMNFQQAMDNTKHQREVLDLKKAGLNPTLSAGSAGSAPSGASNTLTAPQINLPDFMAYGISQQQLANEAQKIATDKGRLQNETNMTAAQVANLIQDTKTKGFENKISEAAQQAIDNAKKLITVPKLNDSSYNFFQKGVPKNEKKRAEFRRHLEKSLNFGTQVQPKP